MFQGEEIDLNSSYCANAEKAVDRHIEILNQELNKAGMNMKRICREWKKSKKYS